jgi:triphosphoribosyl-dephospho-CoA synthase
MSRVRELGAAATRALLRELETTPKPGLVDRDGNGAHRDLSYARLEASALALESVFVEIAASACDQRPSRELREHLADIGRRGEGTMLAASGGSNTHRGAIWALGLLVASAAASGERSAACIAERAGELARMPDRFAPLAASHGSVAARRFHVDGARGEAASGFPHVVHVALPALRAGQTLPDVFLRLVASVDDTCVLHRGGRQAQAIAQRGARKALRAGGSRTPAGRSSVRELERALLARNASPGGCADLLAAALLLRDLAM